MFGFQEIWGNSRLLHHLRTAVQQKKVSHAYLFVGGHGSGKKKIATTFAKYLQCEAPTTEPCGQCVSCMQVEHQNHPDIIFVSSAKKSLGIDEVREQILDTIEILPYQGEKKIYIIPNAHTLTVQAQNALLKTLEEPPSYAIFLLLSEKLETLLPTILSRTVVLQINPLSQKEIGDYLLQHNLVDEAQSQVYAAYAQGCIGQAVDLLQEEAFGQMRNTIIDKLSIFPSLNMAEALLFATELEAYKNDLRFLDIIELWFRDLLVAKSIRDDNFLIQKDKKDQIYAATKLSVHAMTKSVAAVTKAREHLTQNANFRLTMEVMLMELKENEQL